METLNLYLCKMERYFRVLIVIIVGLLQNNPSSAYDFMVNDLYYNILQDKDNEVELTSYVLRGSNQYSEYTVIDIPQEVTYSNILYKVTAISDEAFGQCTNITSVKIPVSVKSIGNRAFQDCHSLESITLPNSLTILNEGIFDGCYKLSSISIPNSIRIIGVDAFHNCEKLKLINLPSNLTRIEHDAFSYCI